MNEDIYKTVEDDYDGINRAFHASYDTTTEFKDEITLFVERLSNNSKILSVGGVPVECNYFLDKGFQVDNVDISQAMLDEISDKSPGTNIIKQNIKTFPSGKSYDGVWACRSLIHIPPPDIEITLKNLRSILNPIGVVGAVFFKSSNKKIEEQVLPEVNSAIKGLKYYRVLYSRDKLNELFKRAGFKYIRVKESADQDGDPTIFILAEAV
ncbi:class I SAM-dependent methyltransferase [Candidatus Nomurabacteria bacterium]|nr:class I SAM-dependent methyltransferase [Candidatus Nomurabacteria bacterium]